MMDNKDDLERFKDVALIVGITILFVVFNLYTLHAFLDGNKDSQVYNTNYFIITVVIGAFAIAIGTFVFVDSIGIGLISGGTILLFYGITRYWKYAGDKAKALVLGVTLACLMIVSYIRFIRKDKK